MFEVATLLGRHTFDWVGWSLGALIGIVASGIEPGRIRRLGLIDHTSRSDESAVAAVIVGLNRLDLAVPTAEKYVTPVQAASPIRPFTDFWRRYYAYEFRRTDKEACLSQRRSGRSWRCLRRHRFGGSDADRHRCRRRSLHGHDT
jgi:pimeloyl-ACP methyl ester carboxylesterase